VISAKDPQLSQVKLHPGLIVIGCLLLSALARHAWHLNLDSESLSALRYIGLAFMFVGVATLVLAYSSMAWAKTTIDPKVHTSRIVTSGIYAYSRNPIYLGWFVLIAGRGLFNASVLALLVAITMLLLLYWVVIVEEETYLESKFGEEYLTYKRSVRRWL
jgi:protein-S-isoprenylcysteine O-methyltransferase Ste14